MPTMTLLADKIAELNISKLKQGERRWLGQLKGSIGSLLLTQLAQQVAQPIVVVARHQQHLAQLESEMGFYGHAPLVFPDWETLPYDRLSPHQDIVSERLNLLAHMPKKGIVLISATTLLQRVVPPIWLFGQYFSIEVGKKFDVEKQREQLIAAGYHLVDTVYEHGEFAIRGSLVDIFASGQEQPIRIDLFDDEVETLRYFDPEIGRAHV